ncbi:FG-GAP-like repeat-containing protein [Streptomyces sp. NPDC057696]|uniref:FG-GAP-like repeat-containing protein n=1 Tax=unclassified Streptomyces TaxID=2593676 RepID=UPI0036C71663
MRKRTLLLATALTTGLLALPLTATPASAAPSGLTGDFNGDGYRDVAIGVPAGITGTTDAGYVAVVYGTSAGLDPAKRKVISQNSTGVPGSSEGGDSFGAKLAIADLDKDGYTDLAVGAPGEDIGSNTDQGSVTILWGGSAGVSGGTTVSVPQAFDGAMVGSELAAGDFDGDGSADLAVSTPPADLQIQHGPFTRSGGAGVTETVHVAAETGTFVRNLTAGDVTGDKKADLVVQARRDIEGQSLAWLYTGSATGLVPAWQLPDSDIAAIGDLDKDGYRDIAVGDSYETSAMGGRVSVVYGAPSGLSTTKGASFHQSTSGVPGTAEPGDMFGGALAIGDTNGDGYGDLVIGAPGEDIGTKPDAGDFVVLRGSASGVTTSGAKSFSQDTSRIPGSAEKGDRFGSALQLSDTNKDGRADLAVSAIGEAAPHESVHSGAVWRIRGASTGLMATGSLAISPDDVGRAWDDETFGAALGGNTSN